jgi:hypothetical protein
MRFPPWSQLPPGHGSELPQNYQAWLNNDRGLVDEILWLPVMLRSAVQSWVSARPESGSERTFGRVSTAISHLAALAWE